MGSSSGCIRRINKERQRIKEEKEVNYSTDRCCRGYFDVAMKSRNKCR